MTVYLLILSFIIDGIIIFGITIMMKKIRRTEEIELRQEQVAAEIEDLFTSYLYELKEENKRWERMVMEGSPEERGQYKERGNPFERNSAVESHSEQDTTPAYSPPIMEDEESYEPSFQSHVLKWKEKGYSIEEIAKKTDKGKTEIELLLKFHQKHEKKT